MEDAYSGGFDLGSREFFSFYFRHPFKPLLIYVLYNIVYIQSYDGFNINNTVVSAFTHIIKSSPPLLWSQSVSVVNCYRVSNCLEMIF